MSHTVTSKYLKDMISVIITIFKEQFLKCLRMFITLKHLAYNDIYRETKCLVQSSIDQITSIVHLYNTLVLL